MNHSVETQESTPTLATALAQHQGNDIEGAEKSYRYLLANLPESAEARWEAMHGYAILLGQLERYKDGLVWAEPLVDARPTPQHYNTLGNLHKKTGQVALAMDAYRAALQLQPDYVVALNALGSLAFQQGQFKKASQQFKAVLKESPDFVNARFHLALCAIQMNDLEEASSLLSQVTTAEPEHHQAWMQWSQLAFQMGQYDQAMQYVQHKLALDPDNVDALHHQAVLCTESEQFEKAVHSFERCVVLQPDHLEAQHNVASCYMRMGQPHRALPHYIYLSQHQPNPDVFFNLGTIYMHQEKHESALIYFNEALKLDAKDLRCHINIASVYLKTRQVDKAKAHYHKAKTLDEANPEYDFILSALDQKNMPNRPPDMYVSHLFDAYANVYDQHLTQCLRYALHQQIHDVITDHHLQERAGIVALDVGCGTGLCGEKVVALCESMDGIDLSEQMLAQARQKRIYRDLTHASYEVYLRECVRTYDWIVAADVLPYVGDPASFIALSASVLKPGGVLIFSTEISENTPLMLQTTMRYAHHPDAVRALLFENGLHLIDQKKIVARHQNNQPVPCYLWMAQSAEPSDHARD